MALSTRSDRITRYYTCPRCGARGEVALVAVGVGRGLFDAQAAAEADQRNDADRVLGLIKCPSCGKRPRGALSWAGIRALVLATLIGGLEVARGVPLWIGLVPAAVLLGAYEWWRFARASHAAVFKLTAPPPAETSAKPAAPVEMPTARALPRKLAPVQPLRTDAPPPQAPAPEPSQEPSLLGNEPGKPPR